MNCVICNSNNLVRKKVDEEIKINNDVIIINLPIITCLDCGERYYTKEDIHLIERTKEKLKTNILKKREVGKVFEIEY